MNNFLRGFPRRRVSINPLSRRSKTSGIDHPQKGLTVELVGSELSTTIRESLDDKWRPSFCNAPIDNEPAVDNVVEQVMLDPIRKDVIEETFITYVSRFLDIHAASDRGWKRWLTLGSILAFNVIFERQNTATIMKENKFIISFTLKELDNTVASWNGCKNSPLLPSDSESDKTPHRKSLKGCSILYRSRFDS